MKFTDDKRDNNQPLLQNVQQKFEESTYEPIEMSSQSDDLADRLQADVVNGCGRVLVALNSCKELEEYIKTDEVEKKVRALQDFHYTIGFAGGQSSGKSTVVNAMLQYPLMPTCKAATTCTPVELFYSERIRITVADADTGKQLMDYPCDKATANDFTKLKEYACAVSALPQVIENLQPFVDGFVGSFKDGIKPNQLDMQANNPKHVAVLMMMLLTVYVKQNLEELTPSQKSLIKLRKKTMAYFKIPSDVPNISVRIQWNSPILKSGLRILDLPGLGANAEDKKLEGGKILKGHDTITKDAAIGATDTMVVVQNPEMLASVLETVKRMVSNLKVKEAVVENCIVPVLNMIDTCVGEAGRENAILEFKTMLQNVGIKKESNEIFPLAAIYGEYAYEECANLGRTLYCSKNLQRLLERGADERRIKNKLDDLTFELEDEYNNSGVEALREFFRTAFIERGKLEKTFSTIAEIRAAGKDAKSKIIAKKRGYEGFAGVNKSLVETAIPKLKEIAYKPINKAIDAIFVGNFEDRISLMTGLSDQVVLDYKKAFEEAAEEYYKRNIKIVNGMTLNWAGFSSYARVDSGKPENYRLYQDFKRESQRILVDMSSVNISYAKVLSLIKKDIETIFSDAVMRLHSFADTYEPNLYVTIGQHREHASADVIKIFEDIIPVISEFVADQIEIVENGINRANRKIEQAQIDIANVIVEKNYEFVSAVSDYAINHIQVRSSRFIIFDEHVKMKIDGSDGARSVLGAVKDLIGDNPEIGATIQTVCSEQIINPMQEWYSSAADSVAGAFNELQEKIGALLDEIAAKLKNNTDEKEEYIRKLNGQLKQVDEIFNELKQSIRTSVEEVLPMAREKNIISQKYEKNMMAWINGGEPVGE